jgi:hypothetical protein
MTLDDWVRRKAPDAENLLLQMDIEGAEYGVLLHTSDETLKRFRILIVEFHGLDALCDRLGFDLVDLTFRKLLRDFEIVHMHPNNAFFPVRFGKFLIPPILEITLLRKDRVTSRAPNRSFPHELDRKCVVQHPEIPLPTCWYSSASSV